MRDGWVGEKYEATKNLSRVEVAKLIRADIKAAVKSGELPKAKYSVTCSRGTGIDVCISGHGIKVYSVERLKADHFNPHTYSGLSWKSEAAAELEAKVGKIRNAYNFDHSDSMTDYFHVRYYGGVDVVGNALACLSGIAFVAEVF